MNCDKIPGSKGVYLLGILLESGVSIEGGLLAGLFVPAGRYVYVGSAGGLGGLRARLCRHLGFKKDKRPKWHVDWLLRRGKIVWACFLTGSWGGEAEEKLSALLSETLEEGPPGFGSTDTRDRTHLFKLSVSPGSLLEKLRRSDPRWECVEV